MNGKTDSGVENRMKRRKIWAKQNKHNISVRGRRHQQGKSTAVENIVDTQLRWSFDL